MRVMFFSASAVVNRVAGKNTLYIMETLDLFLVSKTVWSCWVFELQANALRFNGVGSVEPDRKDN